MKKIVLSMVALAVMATPADAAQKHRKHHTEKAAATGAAVGGVAGLTVGAPVQGAVVGAAAGIAIDKLTHSSSGPHSVRSKKYPGYLYWNGFYYRDGKRFSPEQMRDARK